MHGKRVGKRIVRLLPAALCLALTACEDNCDTTLDPDGRTGVLNYQIAPGQRTLQAGESTTYTVTVVSKKNINADVQLRVDEARLPRDVDVDLRPSSRLASTATSATLTIRTRPTTPGGTYEIKLFASEVGGAPEDSFGQTATLTVQGGPLPVLEVTCDSNPRSGVAPLRVSFTARARGCVGACSFLWNFDDGQSATGDSVEHVYTVPNSYAAILSVGDAQRTVNCRRVVTVTPEDGGTVPGPGPSPAPSPSSSPTTPPSRPTSAE